ncbi:ArsR family transcriptional regulator [Streptomyces sp. NBC_00572]|uniref:ArsR/SmtB family transcription factor n=1 Tax=Streptomyces sp. NBC_00572 TaxID=2903664 RepID=UPI0022560FFA|nr:ArsR family transcriptional regulator [Streptomyces sp. NBC_00572]MCX4985878.1 ArsR family transcriptional regulator [Streptomyces sp. NBC_00572]
MTDMGAVCFELDDLANVRFAVSPLWETVAGVRAVADPGRYALHLPWIKESLGAAGGHPPVPGFGIGLDLDTVPPPRCPLAGIEEELAAAAPEAAEVVLPWWRTAVRPHWPRIRALLEADIAHRTRQLAEDGIGEVLAGLHRTLAWTGDRLVSAEFPPGELGLRGGGVTLVPSAFTGRCRLVPGRGAVPPCVIYPARAVGTLWGCAGGAGDGLARLLGRSRAGLLAAVTAPATTTQLAARTGLTPGAVSQHLAVLRDAGLVTGHRYGREVHYVAVDLGRALLGDEAGR